MIRIAALNQSEDELTAAADAKASPTAEITKEYQETNALSLYNQALSLQTAGENSKAEIVLRKLLACEYVNEVCSPSPNEGTDVNRSMLKYSAYKNLANIAAQKQDYHAAIEAILEAVKIDSTDVTMWYKLGVHAKEINQITLARLAFQQGLNCNSSHWPCLDNLITILFVLGDYPNCLAYISKALEMDSCYAKGIVFRKRMYAEQPSLREYAAPFFEQCDREIESLTVNPEDEDEFVREAILMRQKRLEECGPEFRKLPQVSFPGGLTLLTWIGLGKALMRLYDYVASKKPDLSFGCRVDVGQYLKKKEVLKGVPGDTILSGNSSDYDPLAIVDIANNVPPEVLEKNKADDAEIPATLCIPTSDSGVPIDPPASDSFAVTVGADESEPPLKMSKVGALATNPVRQPVSATINAGDQDDMAKRVYKRRKSTAVTCLDDLSMKRRSARVHVRNAHGKKEDGKVNYHAVLSRVLPVSLRTSSSGQSVDHQEMLAGSIEQVAGMLTSNVGHDTGHAEQTMLTGAEEEKEVEEFLARFTTNGGVLDLMEYYLIELAGKHHLRWPEGLVDVYMSVFEKHHPHMNYPSYRCDEAPSSYICSLAKAGLLQLEFTMDKTAGLESRKARPRAPLKNSPKKQLHSAAGGASSQDSFRAASCCGCSFADMLWLSGLTTRPDILDGSNLTRYALRFFWAEGLLMLLEGGKENAANNFARVRAILDDASPDIQVMKLVNCQNYNIISSRSVESQLQALQRSRSLDEVQQFYDEKNYEKVVELLLPTCAHANMMGPDPTDDVIALQQLLTKERHRQLLLLLESFLHLKNYVHAAVSTEASICESLVHYEHAASGPVRDEWFKTVCLLMKGMIRCITEEAGTFVEGQRTCTYTNVYSQLSAKSRQRLASSTVHVAEMILEAVGDSTCDIPQDIVTPWILLYHLVKQEEDKLAAERGVSPDAVDSGDEVMPASLVILSIAHEYIGRRSWCTASDGLLLLFIVEVFVKELERNRSTGYRDILERNVEQCFFCLYAHPNKKAKAKHLDDHGCTSQVLLTWKRAVILFEFFKPKIMPSFDSYKSSAVSPELEILFGRIVSLVPTLLRPPQKAEESVLAYIDGSTSTFSFRWAELSLSNSKGVAVVKEIFYLLADYYFKNKEPYKAIKYYVTDICLNPGRFDSWAGMALAKCSKLESRLSSVEMQGYDGTLVKLAQQTLRCFEKALELDGTNGKLWIEYGSTAYHLASFVSRLLKQGTGSYLIVATLSPGDCKEGMVHDDNAPPQGNLKKLRSDWLELARRCYSEAARRWEDADDYSEEWLHHYMLGKIAEKLFVDDVDSAADNTKQYARHEACQVYLEHYKMAAHFLHEDGAPYPKKISFIYSAPSLAIEVLEMYYRLHASILKYLNRECTEQDYIMLKQYVDEAQHSPFAMSCETKRGRKSISADSMPATPQERKQDVFGRIPPSSPTGVMKLTLPCDPVAKAAVGSASVVVDDAAAVMNYILDAVVAEHWSCQQAIARPPSNNKSGSTEAQISNLCGATNRPGAMETEPSVTMSSEALVATESMSNVLPAVLHFTDTTGTTASGPSCTLSPCSGAMVAMSKAQKQELAEQCLKALRLCATRYPLHYKSYYRIAYTYVHLDCMKDMRLAREVLLGVSDSQVPGPSCNTANSSGTATQIPQGLFQERKPNNFFNGVWRIPVAEIERPGSFAAHLCRTTELVLNVLESEHDADLLCQLHLQLARVPDTGKKFLRDSDRHRLAGLAYRMSVACYERLLNDDLGCRLITDSASSSPRRIPQTWLLNVYRLWCYGTKQGHSVEKVTAVFGKAFKIYRSHSEEVTKAQLEEAAQFCQQLVATTSGRVGLVTGSSLSHRAIARDKATEALAVKPCAVTLTAISDQHLLAEGTLALNTMANVTDSSTDHSSAEVQPQESYENAAAGDLAMAVPTVGITRSVEPNEKSGSISGDSSTSSVRVPVATTTLVVATNPLSPRFVQPGVDILDCASSSAVTHSAKPAPLGAHTSVTDSSAWLPSSQVTIATDLPSLTDDVAVASVGDDGDESDESSSTTVSGQGGDGMLLDRQISEGMMPAYVNDSQSMETNGEDIQSSRTSELPTCELVSERSLFGDVSSTDEEIGEASNPGDDCLNGPVSSSSNSSSSTGTATDASDSSTDSGEPQMSSSGD